MNYRYETTDASTYQLLLDKAREMRKNPTEAESALWGYLSANKLGAHFRRQHPIFGYIPDFVALNERIIIEVDGGYHLEHEQVERDDERTAWLNQKGYVVLRFTNEEVLCDIDSVIETIADTIELQETNTTIIQHQESNTANIQHQGVVTGTQENDGTARRSSTNKCNPSPLPSGGAGGGSLVRIGFGFDVHQLVAGRELWMGGIRLEHEKGLLGHSDADVLIHAICDALLGAANMRDIGYHFPDTSADTLGMDSKVILRKTIDLIATKGYRLGNIDATICAERPKMNPHIPAMQQCMAAIIGCDPDQVSIKATTTERLGFTGREEGIAAYATVLIERM